MKRTYETEIVPRPAKERRTERLVAASGAALGIILATLGAFSGGLEDGIILVICGSVLVAGCGFMIWRSFSQYERVLSEAGKTQKAIDEAADAEKSRELWERWYLRYPVAGTCFAGAWFLLENPDQLRHAWMTNWIAGGLCIVGLWKARELSLILIAFAAIAWMVFGEGFSLSTPAAILIGAIIIASAISARR